MKVKYYDKKDSLHKTDNPAIVHTDDTKEEWIKEEPDICPYCNSDKTDIINTNKMGKSFTIDKKERNLWFVYCIDCSMASTKEKTRKEAVIKWNKMVG